LVSRCPEGLEKVAYDRSLQYIILMAELDDNLLAQKEQKKDNIGNKRVA